MTIARELVAPIPQSLANPLTGAEPIDEIHGLELYVEASVGEGAIAGEIDTWKDISPEVNDFTQTVAADKGSTDGIVNGRAAYRFLGGDHMDATNNPFSLDSLNFIFGMVIDISTTALIRRLIGNEDGSSGWFLVLDGSDHYRWKIHDLGGQNSNKDGTASSLIPAILVGEFTTLTGNRRFWVNGGSPDIDDTTAGLIDPNLTGGTSSIATANSSTVDAVDADFLAVAFGKGTKAYGLDQVNLLGNILSDISKLPWTTATA